MFATQNTDMFSRKSMDELGRLQPNEVKNTAKTPIVIVLDDVRSMHNVGSVFRTSDAFAIKSIYLCGYTPVPPHRDIRKTALGSEETVDWQHFEQVTDAIEALKKENYKIVAVEQVHNSTSLEQYVWEGAPVALVFGNEVEGVSDNALALADQCIEIPQMGSKHSLNISVSMGVVVWELIRSIA
jgi:tRNA G18 (ribose-2'-O)-methylase SpoU